MWKGDPSPISKARPKLDGQRLLIHLTLAALGDRLR
jgi:hypothetical protein